MSKLLLLAKLMFALILMACLLYVVEYAPILREMFSSTTTRTVAGAQTSFEKEVKKDIVEYLKTAKEQVLNIKLKDIYEPMYNLRRISQDFSGTRSLIENSIKDYLKK